MIFYFTWFVNNFFFTCLFVTAVINSNALLIFFHKYASTTNKWKMIILALNAHVWIEKRDTIELNDIAWDVRVSDQSDVMEFRSDGLLGSDVVIWGPMRWLYYPETNPTLPIFTILQKPHYILVLTWTKVKPSLTIFHIFSIGISHLLIIKLRLIQLNFSLRPPTWLKSCLRPV